MRIIEAELNMKSYERFALSHGLNDNGLVQKKFTELVYEYSEPYTPKFTGVFMTNVYIDTDNIHYISPFANYLWRGKKFVDPEYKKGAFFSNQFGFWSRPGILKEETDIDLEYSEAPMRGPYWINRMWPDKGEEIISITQKYMEKIGGKNER